MQSVAIKIGDDTLEVLGEEKKYWLNGQLGPELTKSGPLPGFTLGGNTVRFRIREDSDFIFKVFLNDGQAIAMKAIKDFMKVDLENHKPASFAVSKGLLGSYEGGLMLARDGATILDDENAFGSEWQVQPDVDGLIFHEAIGPQYPQACAMPDASQAQRRLGEGSLISRDKAAEACKDVDQSDRTDCIADVLATGDPSMAGAF